ncbi:MULTISPECIES: hypothetical protein [unclassified Agrococcus]|uniref:hypothetical protein n=1 Tax=unclassified Agrococcus TaxID=2615065 RepID=UPI0036074584
MLDTRRFPWHVVAAAVTTVVVAIGVRTLLAQLQLFPIVEWGVALLVGFVAGAVVANVVLARTRTR